MQEVLDIARVSTIAVVETMGRIERGLIAVARCLRKHCMSVLAQICTARAFQLGARRARRVVLTEERGRDSTQYPMRQGQCSWRSTLLNSLPIRSIRPTPQASRREKQPLLALEIACGVGLWYCTWALAPRQASLAYANTQDASRYSLTKMDISTDMRAHTGMHCTHLWMDEKKSTKYPNTL
jgi:hypothetical protein